MRLCHSLFWGIRGELHALAQLFFFSTQDILCVSHQVRHHDGEGEPSSTYWLHKDDPWKQATNWALPSFEV